MLLVIFVVQFISVQESVYKFISTYRILNCYIALEKTIILCHTFGRYAKLVLKNLVNEISSRMN